MAIGLQSNQITFIDLTDSRSLNVNIACNLPTTQIHNTSDNTYTPNWAITPLKLTPQIYLGSTELKAGTTGLSIQWRRQEGTDNPSMLVADELVSNGILTVQQNNLSASASGFLTYICTVAYDGMEAIARVSFNLTSTGSNGVNAYVHIKYGTSSTPSVLLDTPSDYMGIYSGSSPTPPPSYTEYHWYKIKGEDGTSVKILGSAYYNGELTDDMIGQLVTIYSDEEFTNIINISSDFSLFDGDAYIVSGYLCIYSLKDDSFICAGQIQGPQGGAGITFQLYAPNGYLLSQDLNSLTLETFAYDNNTQITTGAEYVWSKQENNEWVIIENQVDKTLVITKDDILKSKSYKCDMTYNGITYSATATIQDKNDIYNSVLCISSNTQATSGENYWVLYSLIYSDTTEIDPLLGSISMTEPETPLTNDYWYAIDDTNFTVTLKKFNGTSWEETTDTQQFSYLWSMSRDNEDNVPVGQNGKVNIISSRDFTSTTTLMCEIIDSTDGVLTRSTLGLTDVSDPIVSETEPTNVKHGQIWIKKNSDGTFLMFIWDDVEEAWVISDADHRNRVYTSRPDSYNAGDLWITASDDDHGIYLHGTLLQAQVGSNSYDPDDWSPTLKYDQDINDMKEQLDKLSQYVTINSDGLRIGARTESGQLSPFTSLFTSTELSFYQNADKLLTLANNKLTAPSVEVENHLQVNNMISLGNLRLTIENNGSFSFTVVS